MAAAKKNRQANNKQFAAQLLLDALMVLSSRFCALRDDDCVARAQQDVIFGVLTADHLVIVEAQPLLGAVLCTQNINALAIREISQAARLSDDLKHGRGAVDAIRALMSNLA